MGDQEDASKQGRKLADIDQDEGISLFQEDAETQGRYGHDLMFETSVLDDQEVFTDQEVNVAGI